MEVYTKDLVYIISELIVNLWEEKSLFLEIPSSLIEEMLNKTENISITLYQSLLKIKEKKRYF